MTNTKAIITQMKVAKAEKGLSFGDIMKQIEANGDIVSKSTLSRLFADGSETVKFDYEYTIRPVAKVLLDIETDDEDDTPEIRAQKSVIRLLNKEVAELKEQLAAEKIKSHEKLEKEREQYNKNIEFLKNQIELKDRRMDEQSIRVDKLLEKTFEKDTKIYDLINQTLSCPAKAKFEHEN